MKINNVKFISENTLLSKGEIERTGRRLKIEVNNVKKALKSRDFESFYASVLLPDDEEGLKEIKELIKEKKKLKPAYIIDVGIGGSNLGTIAVQEAVLGKLYNYKNPKTKILYADTVDSDLIRDITAIIEPVLKKGKNIIINGVSKSGGTTETIANFEILVNLIKKYKGKDHYRDFIVVTTDEGSKFWNLAKKKGFSKLSIPKKVGGRYSVFSSVGLFPLGLIGVNIDKLLAGARVMRDRCLKNGEILKNPAALSAILIYLNKKKGNLILNTFLFGPDLESIGKWYRQLMGESIGKEHNRKKEQVFEGITPIVSVGSTDLHSMAQLYLGGPRDKFTNFISVDKTNSKMSIPNFPEYSKLVFSIQGKKLSDIMNAIYKGVKIAYNKGRRPYVEIILPDKLESSIGQLLQLKMMEMIYLGFLLDVNPFDQPNVESYKIETKKILGGKE